MAARHAEERAGAAAGPAEAAGARPAAQRRRRRRHHRGRAAPAGGGLSVGELSMERIARDGGRRQGHRLPPLAGKERPVLDVLRSLDEPAHRLAGTSVRDDLVTLLEFLRRRGLAKRSSALLRTVVSQCRRSPKLWAEYHETVIRARHEALLGVLRRGVANGEIRADHRPGAARRPLRRPDAGARHPPRVAGLPEGLAERIVDTVLEGVRPAADARGGRGRPALPAALCAVASHAGRAPAPPDDRIMPVLSQPLSRTPWPEPRPVTAPSVTSRKRITGHRLGSVTTGEAQRRKVVRTATWRRRT